MLFKNYWSVKIQDTLFYDKKKTVRKLLTLIFPTDTYNMRRKWSHGCQVKQKLYLNSSIEYRVYFVLLVSKSVKY